MKASQQQVGEAVLKRHSLSVHEAQLPHAWASLENLDAPPPLFGAELAGRVEVPKLVPVEVFLAGPRIWRGIQRAP
jgi:hypothetical protein